MASPLRARVAVLICFLSISVSAVTSDAPVTEPEAIRLFLEESPQAQRVSVIVRSADAASRVEAPVANPEIAYLVEDAAGVRDEFLTFQQKLPITGRRELVRDSADAAAEAAGLAAERDLRISASALRQSFYEVLYRTSVSERLWQGAERLERVVEILAMREREGEGSGYDLLRAEQELVEIGIDGAESEAALSVARSRFGAFFDPGLNMESARLSGDLQPTDRPPEPEQAIELALAQRGDLEALRAESQRLELERRAARRQRFPEPTLLAGWKRTSALGFDDTGFTAALMVPLPVFDRGKFSAEHASAQRERAELDAEILEREIRAEVQAALARERAARQAAERHGDGVAQRAAELRRIAELAYAEGEAGILELLDAYRTSLAMELRALALRYEARRAEIDRDRAIGVEVKS